MTKHSQTLRDKVILITGASSGIGEAIARELAAAGAQVVAGARRLDRLQKLQAEVEAGGGRLQVQTLDVTSHAQVDTFARLAQQAYGRVDVIINNAGLMPLSPLAALKIDEWNQMIDVNIRGVLHGIAAVLPIMNTQGHGHVVNVASIGAHRVSPTAAVYCATKYAVWAISDGLRQETDRIRVTTISPGVVSSELADTISDESARSAMRDFRSVAIEPDAIARAVRFAIEQPADVDVSEMIVRPTASPH
ncbi:MULTISPECIES: SDR family oxidoreductase [Hydrocarboniphaga]|jgi:NADP-dependent 3-hydroxy acid dehydrogenase YdfG|uniref:Short-chain dehydrogenase/reductase SDR n=1 Tax=Hydrocarboniphaga effusa AP103 TaxID=1172194 RepID=I8T2U5_9GAMM|nr:MULTISPECIES: SDR family oxidoreductase [Hydrocarboniphaga]EIT67983.1 short-chain dehydrogenase/reductase SDR [Hydrocarboniphaga effusa AP103]MDZ4076958.1 SDR family oxidoreductase [Hydrocarboniphaga sp.]